MILASSKIFNLIRYILYVVVIFRIYIIQIYRLGLDLTVRPKFFLNVLGPTHLHNGLGRPGPILNTTVDNQFYYFSRGNLRMLGAGA